MAATVNIKMEPTLYQGLCATLAYLKDKTERRAGEYRSAMQLLGYSVPEGDADGMVSYIADQTLRGFSG